MAQYSAIGLVSTSILLPNVAMYMRALYVTAQGVNMTDM